LKEVVILEGVGDRKLAFLLETTEHKLERDMID